jgi:hypothetical protein
MFLLPGDLRLAGKQNAPAGTEGVLDFLHRIYNEKQVSRLAVAFAPAPSK